MPRSDRRGRLAACFLACFVLALAIRTPAVALDAKHHALSMIGEPKHGPAFQHFDWVNPNAPKGGVLRQAAIGTFDSLNRYAAKGNPAAGLGLLNATLMASSLDEPSTQYGLIAAWVSHPADFSSATFGLRAEARFHDGAPITPEDVVFTIDALTKAHPRFALYYQNVVGAEKSGPHQVTFRFDVKGNRELPQIVGALPILPKHYWSGKDASGEPRDLARGTLEAPIGSGPYRVAAVDAPAGITYVRVADWWAKDLPVARGQWNFDEIRYSYYRERLPAFEAFKIGATDFWLENSAKGWATGYDIDAVRSGLIKKELVETRALAHMQGFAFNTRRKQLQDSRVRQAFNLAFNFEWANQAMMFGAYKRLSSYFENSELAATGLPQGRELELLEKVRTHLPPKLFTEPYRNPVNSSPEHFRKHMGAAARLLAEAGWSMKDGVLTNKDGTKLEAEVLLIQKDFERLVLAYKDELEKLGMRIFVRTIDAAQYRKRLNVFDFDIVVHGFPQSHSPGNEQREFWGSAAADREATQNIIGIKNPAVDTLIDAVIFAKDRADLVAATRALDRVLCWNHYVVPQFYAPADRIAYWDKFNRPGQLPRHAGAGPSFQQVWWYDEATAKRLAAARKP